MKKILILIGRILFSLQFFAAMGMLFSEKAVAGAAANGFPLPSISAKLAAIMALLGALSILVGYKTKLGAILIVLFLIPVTFTMHAYWNIANPAAKAEQFITFLKNINAIGGALILYYFGAGPLSLDGYISKNDK